MKTDRNVLLLLLFYVFLLLTGLLVIHATSFQMSEKTYATLLTVMTIITMGAYLLISIGTKKEEKERGIFILAGIGGKFVAYLFLILAFWAGGKNLTREFIIVFFVLYLFLTFFLVRILYKTLKSN